MKAGKSGKMVAFVTAAVLAGSIAVPMGAWAADTQSKGADLKTDIESTYTLKIPSETTITFGSTNTDLNGVLKVSGNVDVGEKVIVTAKPNALENASHGEELAYTLMDGKTVFESAEWSEAQLRTGLEGDGKGKELQLSITIKDEDWKAAKAGSYKGSITFTAELN